MRPSAIHRERRHHSDYAGSRRQLTSGCSLPFIVPAFLGGQCAHAGRRSNANSGPLAILVLDVTNSAATLGTILSVVAIPRTVLMLAGGVATDRFRARTVLLGTNVSLAVIITLLGVSAAVSGLALWHLFLYAAIFGTLGAFALPAGQSILADLVPVENVRGANALGTTTFNFAAFLIPPVAGTLIATAGVGTAYIVLLLYSAALCLWTIRSVEATVRIRARTNSLEQIREGFIATWRAPILRIFVASATIFG